MTTGVIAKLTDKGFGFITVEGMNDDVFFHAQHVADGMFNDLQEGETVEFELGENEKGAYAEDVQRKAA